MTSSTVMSTILLSSRLPWCNTKSPKGLFRSNSSVWFLSNGPSQLLHVAEMIL
ncbi:hypothetical protein Hanom_Chr05g00402791 [Helianthus anomalus]